MYPCALAYFSVWVGWSAGPCRQDRGKPRQGEYPSVCGESRVKAGCGHVCGRRWSWIIPGWAFCIPGLSGGPELKCQTPPGQLAGRALFSGGVFSFHEEKVRTTYLAVGPEPHLPEYDPQTPASSVSPPTSPRAQELPGGSIPSYHLTLVRPLIVWPLALAYVPQ